MADGSAAGSWPPGPDEATALREGDRRPNCFDGMPRDRMATSVCSHLVTVVESYERRVPTLNVDERGGADISHDQWCFLAIERGSRIAAGDEFRIVRRSFAHATTALPGGRPATPQQEPVSTRTR